MVEIWNSKEMNDLRLRHLKGKRKDTSVCKDCGQLSHCLPDNIDGFRKELLPKFETYLDNLSN